MAAVANLAEHLAPLVGAEHVVAREDGFIVSPASTEEVSAVLSFADRHGLKVRPTGGCTKLSWGDTTKTDIELSLLRMNRVLEHSWQDLVCRMQAGCTWDKMQQALAKHGQFVALDPLWPERATVGGILATNDSGAIRHRYGSLRDLVIGMTIVLADGTIAKSGGKVVKNVAGYDLPKLMTGSFGTLAIITEANFRLYPLPQHVENFTVSAPKAAQLAPLMQAIRDSHLLTQAVQLRGGDSHGFTLDVQLNSHPAAEQHTQLSSLTAKFGLEVAPSEEQAWGVREQLFQDEDSFVIKISTQPSHVASIAEKILLLGGKFVSQSFGVTTASLPAATHTTAYAIDELRNELKKVFGILTVLRTPGLSWNKIAVQNTDHDVFKLMQAVKHQFDPNNTLSNLTNQ